MAKRDPLLSKAYEEISRMRAWEHIYSGYVKPAKRDGDWINAGCPLPTHTGKDRNPSFGYNRSEGTYNCFVCGGGDAVDFLMHMGESYERAREKIIRESGISVSDKAAEQYAGIGYFPEKKSKGGSFKYVDSYIYTKAGVSLYRKNRYERQSAKGKEKVFDFWKYKVEKWQISGKDDPITSGERVLFNEAAIRLAKENSAPLFLVEGEKDVHTLTSLGSYAVTAGGTNEWQERFCREMKGLTVFVIPDNDVPGMKAAKRILSDLQHNAISCRLFNWSKVTDALGFPGELKQSHGEDITDLKEFLTTRGQALSLDYIQQKCVVQEFDDTEVGEDTKHFPLNDVGNARRLIAGHGRDIRFCPEWNTWLLYDGYWKTDRVGEIYAKIRDIVKSLEEEGKESETLFKFSVRSGFNGRIVAIAEQAKTFSEYGIPLEAQIWDRYNSLLCAENGTIDLKLGDSDKGFEVREHRREDYITKMMPVRYDKDAKCPLWLKFLEEILPDKATREFIKRGVGYTLTGDTSEDVMFILYGSGSNGKSTFVDTVAALLGDYAKTINPETLLHKENSYGPNTEIAAICGARFVRTSEQDEGRRLSESIIKQLTSGEPVSARFLYGRDFNYMPTYKIWFSTNHKPLISGTDDGIWRRICLVPFEVKIPQENRDAHLDEKLKTELPGILNWALEGLIEFKRIGLKPPAKVNGAIEQYRSEQDILGSFIEDVVVKVPKKSVMASKLYRAYEKYCDQNGLYKLSQTKFGTKFCDYGFNKSRTAGIIHYRDISIAQEWDPDELIPLPDDKNYPFR